MLLLGSLSFGFILLFLFSIGCFSSFCTRSQVPLLIPALGLKAFRLAGEIADGALASLCPVPYLLNQALPALQAGAEERSRAAPPIVACLPVAVSQDEAAVLVAVRQLIQQLAQTSTYA